MKYWIVIWILTAVLAYVLGQIGLLLWAWPEWIGVVPAAGVLTVASYGQCNAWLRRQQAGKVKR